MTDATVTFQGRATAAPELRHLSDGKPVANFNLAHTERRRNASSGEWEDFGETLFLRVVVWGDQATYVAESVTKGTELVVIGRLRQPAPYEVDGQKRTAQIECTASVVSIDLRRARAVVTRVRASSAEAPAGDSWAAPSTAAAAA